MTARPSRPITCAHDTEVLLPLRVLYSIIPAQNEVADCPGRPAEVDISDVLVGGVSILPALSREQMKALAEEIL